MSIVLDALIYATGWAHVLLAPLTKVEESFNLHATHDVLMYGVGPKSLSNYDHYVFPGAVPRTFIGSVVLAWLTAPFAQLMYHMGYISTKLDIQIIARLVLTSLNAWILCLIRRSTSRRFGNLAGIFFALLTCSQFHYPFWMGRTIPNMFATIPVNISTYFLLDRPSRDLSSKRSLATVITLMTFTSVVFRAEVVLLLGPTALQFLWSRKMSFSEVLKVGIISSFLSIALTATIDSYFWNKYPLWPEFSGIYFNVFEGKSADWGTSPFLTYFVSCLPKLLLGSLPLALVGFIVDRRIRTLLVPSLTFITLISCLGHKEWRFIIYVVPVFNVAASRAASFISKVSLHNKNIILRLFFLVPIGLIAMNIAITTIFTQSSMSNYPGGEALLLFHRMYPQNTSSITPHIHISNLAAQTGASLFLHLNAPPYYSVAVTKVTSNTNAHTNTTWIYDKTENLTLAALSAPTAPFTHLISEVTPDSDQSLSANWDVVGTVQGFDRWTIDWGLIKGERRGELLTRFLELLRMEKRDMLWILCRR